MRNFVVVNSKGGVGKTTLAIQVLPVLLNASKSLFYYQLDNNNRIDLQSEIITIKQYTLNRLTDAIDEVEFFDTNINIIDAGGGDDTFKVLKELSISSIAENLNFIVPTTRDLSVVFNLRRTLGYIYDNFPNPNVYLFLNFANSTEKIEIKKEFGNIFGDEEFEIEGISKDYPQMKYGVVPNSYLFQILDLKKTTFIDFLRESEVFKKGDFNSLKKEIAKRVEAGEITKEEGFKEFKELKRKYRLYNKAVELKKTLFNLNEKFLKDFK